MKRSSSFVPASVDPIARRWFLAIVIGSAVLIMGVWLWSITRAVASVSFAPSTGLQAHWQNIRAIQQQVVEEIRDTNASTAAALSPLTDQVTDAVKQREAAAAEVAGRVAEELK